MRRLITSVAIICLIASMPGALASSPKIGKAVRVYNPNGPGDATVVAVLDFGTMPYHWDFLGSKMPQHRDADPSNDLPLDVAPHEWLPGFPNPKREFASYNRLALTLDAKKATTTVESLKSADAAKWAAVKPSTPEQMNYYWMPGTKVIGAMTFDPATKIVGTPGDHGVGTTSSAVGNLHGTCPECLLFFIELGSVADSEKAIEWAMDQPWIDAISNSYGFSAAYRDRLYSGSNLDAQRKATERGQTVFFSAGNGQDGAFVTPNTTSFSSQEGPDWIVTVGAITPGADNYYYREGYAGDAADKSADHASYMGHGKPSDVAGIGGNYPTAYTSMEVGGTGTSGFGGTSNATPQITGTYARALYFARRNLAGASKIQRNDVIAIGRKFRCGAKRRECELADGKLTATELRTRLFHGALHTEPGISGPGGVGQLPAVGEEEFLNEGHGSYFGRETGRLNDYDKEFQRIVGPLFGTGKALERPVGETEWMIVDSFCRQHLWGAWKGGYYIEGKTELPESTPTAPLRTLIKESCPLLQPPP